jgi:hypothetical protein
MSVGLAHLGERELVQSSDQLEGVSHEHTGFAAVLYLHGWSVPQG